MEDDELHLPEIGPHSVEKIRKHDYYAATFAVGMAGQWPQRAYIGLYSGAGMARVRGTGEIVQTSALGAIGVSTPFTKYIFVDEDERCIAALKQRVAAIGDFDVTYICGGVNESVGEVIEAMPTYSTDNGLLSLCFVDPFRLDLDFEVLRRLGRYRIDFLVMLPLYFDGRRNFRSYFADVADERVGRLIDDPEWREDWRRRGQSDSHAAAFVLEKFDLAMQRIGYLGGINQTISIKVPGMGVKLYSLGLYSKSERGIDFWRKAKTGTDPQLELL